MRGKEEIIEVDCNISFAYVVESLLPPDRPGGLELFLRLTTGLTDRFVVPPVSISVAVRRNTFDPLDPLEPRGMSPLSAEIGQVVVIVGNSQ